MMWKKVSICLVMVALLAGSAVWAGSRETEYAAFPKAWEKAYNSGDASAVAAMYGEDGMRMPPDAPIVKGRAAIEAYIAEGMKQGLAGVKIETVESHVGEDMAHARGTFESIDADGNSLGSGKWVSFSKHVGGKWQIQFDIWNFDAPRPAAE